MFDDDFATFIDPNRVSDPNTATPAIPETETLSIEDEPPIPDAA